MKYFLHDTNSFQDEKITELFMAFGYEGLGLFYTVLERLAQQEKPVKTAVLKQQLNVGKKLEKCWLFLEETGLISSNNGETFNNNLLKFSEKYQVSKEKTRERVARFRENQALTEEVTRYNRVSNAPKVKISKDKISTSNEVHAANAAASAQEKKVEANLSIPENPDSQKKDAPAGPADVPTRKARPHAYDPADIAAGLVLPFDTQTFRALWAGYRQYREEQLLPRLNGGMQEQEALRNLSNLAQGNEARAAAIIAQTIRNGWKNLFKLDEPRPDHRPQDGATGYGQRPASAVHANPFGIASPVSLAIARAVVTGGNCLPDDFI